MKIKYENEDYYIYITKEQIDFDLNNKEKLVDYIKKTIIRLKVFYNIHLQGFYKLYVYPNEKYGIILKIICLDDIDIDTIDLRIMIKRGINLYLKTEDYFIFKDKNLYYNDYYYKNIKDIEDIYPYIEYCDLYLDEENKIKSITL